MLNMMVGWGGSNKVGARLPLRRFCWGTKFPMHAMYNSFGITFISPQSRLWRREGILTGMRGNKGERERNKQRENMGSHYSTPHFLRDIGKRREETGGEGAFSNTLRHTNWIPKGRQHTATESVSLSLNTSTATGPLPASHPELLPVSHFN